MPDVSPALLSLQNVHGYYGESHILHGVSLEVRRGETVGLLGRNGAGKTTTLRAITGTLSRSVGKITFAGRDLAATAVHRRAWLGIGYVPEERGIFSTLSVQENLLLPPRVGSTGLSLKEIYELFPNLYERRTSQGTKLSGGEQQMLSIARVLRAGVDLLLLDEPTEGLAPVIVQRIGEVLQVLKQRGMTILLVEQNFRFARAVADRLCLMESGRVVDSFAVGELGDRLDQLHAALGV